MRFFKSILLHSALIFYLLLPSTTNAVHVYNLTPDNFDEVIEQIERKYGFIINQGSGINSLITFLNDQLNRYPQNHFCPPPIPSISLIPSGSLLFSWPSISKSRRYQSAYYSLGTGNNQTYQTVEPQVAIGLTAYEYHLFSFFSVCESSQGSVNLIIVDNDVFTLDDSFETDRLFDQLRSIPIFSIFTLSPNPAAQQLQLYYELLEKQDVMITLRDINGKLVQPIIQRSQLHRGIYREHVDLSDLPAGIYICTLIADRPYSKRFIKKAET